MRHFRTRRPEHDIVFEMQHEYQETDDSGFDGITIQLHRRFEKVGQYPHLNLEKVDQSMKEQKLDDFKKEQSTGQLEKVEIAEFAGTFFHRRSLCL